MTKANKLRQAFSFPFDGVRQHSSSHAENKRIKINDDKIKERKKKSSSTGSSIVVVVSKVIA
jgi:hypothetical protein